VIRKLFISKTVGNGLTRASGKGLFTLIALAGDRRESECSARVAELAGSADDRIAEAAIGALGRIASPVAIEALTRLHGATRRSAAAHALPQAGQELAGRGNASEAAGVLQRLTGDAEAPQIRRGASLALARMK
jgi:HEAT repeat protein